MGLGVDLDGVVCSMMVYVPALCVCALSKIREIQVPDTISSTSKNCFTQLDYFWIRPLVIERRPWDATDHPLWTFVLMA